MIDYLKRIGIMAIVLVFIQVLLLGNIHILGVASPLLYIYFVVQTPRNTPRWLILVSCFIQGLLIDIFFSTPGMAAASMTLMGFVQPRILELYLHNADDKNYCPGIQTMGTERFTAYVLFLTVIYCMAFFTLEAFSIQHWGLWFFSIIGSTFVTVFSIVILSIVFNSTGVLMSKR
jgi:rod shape-determining protein MreD